MSAQPREPAPVPPMPGKVDPVPPEMPMPGGPTPEDMPTPTPHPSGPPQPVAGGAMLLLHRAGKGRDVVVDEE